MIRRLVLVLLPLLLASQSFASRKTVRLPAAGAQIGAIRAPGTGDLRAAEAGQDLTTIMQGGSAQGELPVAAEHGQAHAPAPLAAASPEPAERKAAPSVERVAVSQEAPKLEQIDGKLAYGFRRLVIGAAAALFGVNHSLPQAGPRLTEKVLARVAEADLLFSDIDDTAARYNTQLEPETVRDVVSVLQAGKAFMFVTDRPDEVHPKSSQKTPFWTLEPIPAQDRAGLVTTTNGGGRIYLYDHLGTPRQVFNEPGLTDEEQKAVEAAAEAVSARLPSLGTALERVGPGPYGTSIILKLGTDIKIVKAVAAEYQKELEARGLHFEVEGKNAKNPAVDSPYASFSKLDKSLAVRNILDRKTWTGELPESTIAAMRAEHGESFPDYLKKFEELRRSMAAKIRGASAERIAIVGDSMYMPARPKADLGAAGRFMDRWALRLSGREAMDESGNRTDRNMEKGAPGALTLSVGETADASMSEAFVLEGKGPATARRVYKAAASKPFGYASWGSTLRAVAPALLVIAMAVFAYASLIGMFVEIGREAGPWVMPAPENLLHFLPGRW